MSDTQYIIYWVGVYTLTCVSICGFFFMAGLVVNYAWNKAKDIYTFPKLIKAIRMINAESDKDEE